MTPLFKLYSQETASFPNVILTVPSAEKPLGHITVGIPGSVLSTIILVGFVTTEEIFPAISIFRTCKKFALNNPSDKLKEVPLPSIQLTPLFKLYCHVEALTSNVTLTIPSLDGLLGHVTVCGF